MCPTEPFDGLAGNVADRAVVLEGAILDSDAVRVRQLLLGDDEVIAPPTCCVGVQSADDLIERHLEAHQSHPNPRCPLELAHLDAIAYGQRDDQVIHTSITDILSTTLRTFAQVHAFRLGRLDAENTEPFRSLRGQPAR